MASAADADAALVATVARHVADSFSRYNAAFGRITRRAPQRFDAREWHAAQADAVERIDLYDQFVDSAVAELRLTLGARSHDRALWTRIRDTFATQISDLPDVEFSKTFFSSISRRLFDTIGVAPELEFIATELDPLADVGTQVITNVYVNRGSLRLLFEDVLGDVRFRTPWLAFENSADHVTRDVQIHMERLGERRPVQRVEVIRPIFHQLTRAYVVGRIVGEGFVVPLAIALANGERGLHVDAVMLTTAEVSILFGFTRSYFHVDLERVAEAVAFLKSVMPQKPVSELFTVLGRARQGKTERYRELMRHMAATDDSFVHAAGERGLVMACFTLPSFDLVFKVIRDRFPYPKNVVREEVMQKYAFVFRHDRAGRLVDAQEFHELRFPSARFAPPLLEELLTQCTKTVHVDGDDIVLGHVYIERRMTPLNLYLRSEPPEAAARAVVDYGRCLRDLAHTDIFAGDLLLKNFGVTRHGRVIFYDYDELCRITECRFRDLPQSNDPDDEMRGEPWFYVGDADIFPETFLTFLAFDDAQRQVFLDAHGELLTADWWRGVQHRLADGEVLEVLPYARPRGGKVPVLREFGSVRRMGHGVIGDHGTEFP